MATLLAEVAGELFVDANLESKSSNDLRQAADASPPEWVRLVADYHALYARETISEAPTQLAHDVSAKLTRRLGRKLVVPKLARMGLEVKRVQTLTYSD